MGDEALAPPTGSNRWTTAHLAMGANLGDRAANIAAAIAQLRALGAVRRLRMSSLIENPAVGGPAGAPAFLNAAAEIQTTLSAGELLETLLRIESSLGRVRAQRWAPRLIDLDLLLYGDLVIHQPGLIVPHPLMHERRFVLQPLNEIAPNVVHPVFGLTITELLARRPVT